MGVVVYQHSGYELSLIYMVSSTKYGVLCYLFVCVSPKASAYIFIVFCVDGSIYDGSKVQQFYNSHKATNYELLVSRPGEIMESIRAGGYYYYYYLEHYHCTIQY